MSNGLTNKQKEVRLIYAMIKLHLNTAEVHLKKLRDELREVEPAITLEAFQFARNKVQDLYDKYRSIS